MEKFIKPEMEIIEFEAEDVITDSTVIPGNNGGYIDDEDDVM